MPFSVPLDPDVQPTARSTNHLSFPQVPRDGPSGDYCADLGRDGVGVCVGIDGGGQESGHRQGRAGRSPDIGTDGQESVWA